MIKKNYIRFDQNGHLEKYFIQPLTATSSGVDVIYVFADFDTSTTQTAYRTYARLLRADGFPIGPINMPAGQVNITLEEVNLYGVGDYATYNELTKLYDVPCRMLIATDQMLTIAGSLGLTVVYEEVDVLGKVTKIAAQGYVTIPVTQAVPKIFIEDEYNDIKTEMLPRDLGDITISEEFKDTDHLVIAQDGVTKKITGSKLKNEIIKNIVDDTLLEEQVESTVYTSLTEKEQEYAPRLTIAESELPKKRDKSVKINKNDMDISSNANKLGLVNLQDEVIQAISGNAPVNNVIADNAIDKEMAKFSQSILKDDKRTGVTIKASKDNGKSEETKYNRDDLKLTTKTIDAESLINKQNDEINEVWLSIRRTDFVGDTKWDFIFMGNQKISAYIEDRQFLKDVRDGKISFSADTKLKVKLRVRYLSKEESGSVSKIHYTVIEVLDVIKVEDKKQITLDLD